MSFKTVEAMCAMRGVQAHRKGKAPNRDEASFRRRYEVATRVGKTYTDDALLDHVCNASASGSIHMESTASLVASERREGKHTQVRGMSWSGGGGLLRASGGGLLRRHGD